VARVKPAVVVNVLGRLAVFAVAPNGELWHIWQESSGWSNWVFLDGGLDPKFPLAAAFNKDRRLEVFGVASGSHAIWRIWQLSTSGPWSKFASLGGTVDGFLGAPAVGTNMDGRLELFVIGTDQGMGHNWQVWPGCGWHSESHGWEPLRGRFGSPPGAALNGNGVLVAFANGPTGVELFADWQVCPGCGWYGWTSLGKTVTTSFSAIAPVVATNGDGRLEVFLHEASHGVIRHTWQTSNAGGWIGRFLWISAAEEPCFTSQALAAATNKDGRLEVFAQAMPFCTDLGAMRHSYQLTPGGDWSSWTLL